MHICHVISGYFRNDARVFLRQCLTLVEAGHMVSIITNDGIDDEINNGVKIFSTGPYWPRWKTLTLAKKQFKKKCLMVNADVYQMHSPELLPLALHLKKRGYKVIYDAHEDMETHILEKEWLPLWSRKIVSSSITSYMNFVVKKLDQVISPHSHVVSRYQRLFKKGVLIANFPIIKPLRENHFDDFGKRKPIFCYSGTVYYYSNQETFIAAISNLDDAVYDIAGVIDEDFKISLQQLDIAQKTKFHGRLSQADLRQLYLRSIAGVAIYDYKLNLGYKVGSYGTNKLFEYLEAGLPVICTNYDLWREIIDEYNCGFCVAPGDENEIKKAVAQLCENRALAKKMGQNARRAAVERFNWDSEAKKYLEVFE